MICLKIKRLFICLIEVLACLHASSSRCNLLVARVRAVVAVVSAAAAAAAVALRLAESCGRQNPEQKRERRIARYGKTIIAYT